MKVLYASKNIRTQPGRRLTETGDFVLAVMHPQAFAPEQRGIRALQKVRLLHASIRYHLLRHGWDSQQHGVPISQVDEAGTNGSFGWVVLQGLKKMGISPSYEQKQAYLHLWRVLGYALGVKAEYLSDDPAVNQRWEQQIAHQQFGPSPEGRELTASLVAFLKQESPIRPLARLTETIMQAFMGPEVAQILGLPSPKPLPPGGLPTLMAPLPLAGGNPSRDPAQGYHQARLRLAEQKQKWLHGVPLSDHFRPGAPR